MAESLEVNGNLVPRLVVLIKCNATEKFSRLHMDKWYEIYPKGRYSN